MKIKQIIPIPQGRKYYAVFTDENSNSGYYAERVDFIAVVENCEGTYVVGLLGGMELADSWYNYDGTFSEDVLANEFPELWEEMSSDLQNELSPWEQIIAAQRGRLYSQSELIGLLKEKIASLEKNNSEEAVKSTELSPAEVLYTVRDKMFESNSNTEMRENNEELESSTKDTSDDPRLIPLVDLVRDNIDNTKPLSYRAFNALGRAGITTLGEVADKSLDELLQIRLIGDTILNNILEVLKAHGLILRDMDSQLMRSVKKLKKNGSTSTEIAKQLNISRSLAAKYMKCV